MHGAIKLVVSFQVHFLKGEKGSPDLVRDTQEQSAGQGNGETSLTSTYLNVSARLLTVSETVKKSKASQVCTRLVSVYFLMRTNANQ